MLRLYNLVNCDSFRSVLREAVSSHLGEIAPAPLAWCKLARDKFSPEKHLFALTSVYIDEVYY